MNGSVRPVNGDCQRLDTAACELVATGRESGLRLRVLGGLGIWQRLGEEERAAFERVRGAPKDIDLLAPKRSGTAITEVLTSLGYEPDERLIAWHGASRHRYFSSSGRPDQLEIDVFLGEPPSCHDLGLIDVTAGEAPALPVTDLLLQKLQITQVTDRDLADICLIAAACSSPGGDLARPEEEQIDVARIADLLAGDWGFHYTATSNLDSAMSHGPTVLPESIAARAEAELGRLRRAIDDESKSRRWQLRARIGTRKQWYRDVEEVDR